MRRAASLDTLLAGLADPGAGAALEVTGLALDSRGVVPGDLFLAYPGSRQDGRAFIGEALARGAAAVAFDPAGFDYTNAVPGVPVPGLAARASEIGARFYARPSEQLPVIGVTGTNGKTSCVHFLAQALEQLGRRPRMIGTLGSGRVGAPASGVLTTPGPLELQRLLREYLDDGATDVVMEVSSHALVQSRVAAVAFDGALFTNLSRDHLDYHPDMEDYARAKASLFDFESLRFAVVNSDDAIGRRIQSAARCPVLGVGGQGKLRATAVRVREHGMALRLSGGGAPIELSLALVGRLNVANVLAVAGVLLQAGYPRAAVGAALNSLAPVPGRMELLHGPRGGPTAVVDYAHTPDALERALRSLREHCRKLLWCVFGCGGDRDRGKRPQMGRIAEACADRVVLTNDNPRGESPAAIVAEIRAGMHRAPQVLLDRRAAIATAIGAARDGDWVLVAGKGHEPYQVIGERVTEFDDRAVVAECLGRAA